MKQPTLMERLRYGFDNTMSRGTVAIIGWLALVSLLFILVMAAIITLTGAANLPDAETANPDYIEIAWRSFMHSLDSGALGGDTGSPGYLLSMLVVTLGGIFILSTLIGVLTSGIEDKIGELRKGRSFVIEQDHTLILGWTSQIFTILSEIIEANANRKKASIVILADKDKVEMEDEIHARVSDTKRTRIVCRTGSPLDPTDLQIVNPDAARSIIVLAPEEQDPDTNVIKTILAITHNPKRKQGKYNIVAEIREPKNVRVAQMVGRDEVETVLVGDLISRITVQTCRQSGLSVIYTELLDFGGDEIYFQAEPSLTGKTFGQALMAYEDSAVMGLYTRDGTVCVNPPMDTVIADGDKVIAISEDDDTVRVSNQTDFEIDESAIQLVAPVSPSPERTLILGWNERGASIVRELDNYVAAGSYTRIVSHTPDVTAEFAPGVNQTVEYAQSETTDRQVLDALDIFSYNHIIVLSYADISDEQQADAQTLITLLHLRDMGEQSGKGLSIVSEMRDIRNRELAEATRADDFIVSDQLISLLLSQVSENQALNAVFEDLFSPEGSEIYLKPVTEFLKPGASVNFYTVLSAASRRGEVAIGYRLTEHARDASRAYGIVLNPRKSEKITFSAQDKIVVLAEA